MLGHHTACFLDPIWVLEGVSIELNRLEHAQKAELEVLGEFR